MQPPETSRRFPFLHRCSVRGNPNAGSSLRIHPLKRHLLLIPLLTHLSFLTKLGWTNSGERYIHLPVDRNVLCAAAVGGSEPMAEVQYEIWEFVWDLH